MLHASLPRRFTSAFALQAWVTVFLLLVSSLEIRAAYALNAQEQAIADLMLNDSSQGRPTMTLDPILARVARERAADLANRNYFSHTNPDGNGPNYLVTQAGYVLPAWWGSGRADNFIESIAGGTTTASATWTGWMNSPGHRTHILAQDPFYVSQTSYGVGYYYNANSTYRHYWVILTAPPNLGTPPVEEPEPEPEPVPTNAALFVAQTAPATMLPGQSYSVSLEMVNTGTQTWTPDTGYQLGSKSPTDNSIWGLSRVPVSSSVPPAGSLILNFTVTAPATDGTFDFQWQMLAGNGESFGEITARLAIVVGTGTPAGTTEKRRGDGGQQAAPTPTPAPNKKRGDGGQQATPTPTPAPNKKRGDGGQQATPTPTPAPNKKRGDGGQQATPTPTPAPNKKRGEFGQ